MHISAAAGVTCGVSVFRPAPAQQQGCQCGRCVMSGPQPHVHHELPHQGAALLGRHPSIHPSRAHRLLLLVATANPAHSVPHQGRPLARQSLHTHRQLAGVCGLSADNLHDCLHIILAQGLRRIEAALVGQAPVHTEQGHASFRLPTVHAVGNRNELQHGTHCLPLLCAGMLSRLSVCPLACCIMQIRCSSSSTRCASAAAAASGTCCCQAVCCSRAPSVDAPKVDVNTSVAKPINH